MLLFKLFVFLMFARWVMENVGWNKILAAILLLIGGYYVFIYKWTFFGALAVFFLIVLGMNLGFLFQDLLFQKDFLMRPEMEHMENAMMGSMMMRRVR